MICTGVRIRIQQIHVKDMMVSEREREGEGEGTSATPQNAVQRTEAWTGCNNTGV